MTDPQKISGPGLAARLIDSMATDRPSDEARRTAATVLGIALPAAPPTTKLVIKSPMLAALSTVAVIGGALLLLRSMIEPEIMPAVRAAQLVVPVAAIPSPPPPPPPPSPTPAPPPSPTPAPIVVVRPAAKPRSVPREVPTETRPEATELSSLRAETALLDSARAALHQKAAATAVHLLDRYAREFPRGVLEIEASALYVEALFLSGDRATAFALGQAFLDAHGDSALANRVRSLIADEQRRDQNEPSRH